MSKKFILAGAVLALGLGQVMTAQTNLQIFYDFGRDRNHVTTTLEGFYGDNWGNTFFFVDHDFNGKSFEGKRIAPGATYMEIARCLNFWQNTKLGGLSFQVEYNGGLAFSQYSVPEGYPINHAFLTGLDYFLHSADFRNTFNFKVLYKYIVGGKSKVPMQFTFVWGMQDLFGLKGLRFSGFADFWWEEHSLYSGPKWDKDAGTYQALGAVETSQIVFISEPQLWYNVGQWFGCPNLNIGGEVELSWDFGTVKGFHARPCAGMKWVF